jgi:hypothetical protein
VHFLLFMTRSQLIDTPCMRRTSHVEPHSRRTPSVCPLTATRSGQGWAVRRLSATSCAPCQWVGASLRLRCATTQPCLIIMRAAPPAHLAPIVVHYRPYRPASAGRSVLENGDLWRWRVATAAVYPLMRPVAIMPVSAAPHTFLPRRRSPVTKRRRRMLGPGNRRPRATHRHLILGVYRYGEGQERRSIGRWPRLTSLARA